MPVHERVLEAALRLCRERGGWTFGVGDIVAALPDLNPGSVRTHLMSRCCVNAPAHHAHRWPYFRRRRRGVYEILPAWRRGRGSDSGLPARAGDEPSAPEIRTVVEVRESGTGFVARIPGHPRAVRGASLDAVAAMVREVASKARDTTPGRPAPLRLHVDLDPGHSDPVVEAYEKGVDRTVIHRNLRLGFEERLLALQSWMKDTQEIRGAARRPRRRRAT